MKTRVWGLIEAATGELLLVDGRLPLFWLQARARAFAHVHGFTTAGRGADVQICRVEVRTAAR